MPEPGEIETAPPVESAPTSEPTSAPEPLPGFLTDFDPDSGPGWDNKAEPFDYQALLESDPFNPKPKKEADAPAKPAPQATPAAPGAGQAPAGQMPKPAAVTPAAPSAPDPRDLELKLIKEQMSSLRGILDSVSRAQTPQQQAQPAQTQEPEAPQIPTPAYKYNIPDEWVEGLASEDANVRKNSLAVLLQGVSQVIHREAIQHARREIQEQFAAQVPNAVQNVIQSREFGQRVESDYYGKFNHHANFRPLVSEMTKQVFAETGAQTWSPEIRDAIGQRVQNYLQAALVGMQGSGPIPAVQPGVQAPAAPVYQAPAATVPKAPHVFGGIASPGVGVGAGVLNPNSPDGIADALSY